MGKKSLLGVICAGTALGAYLKKNKVSPKSAVNRAVKLVKYNTDETNAMSYSNGAALVPPMGWSSWNTFRNHVTEDVILDTAEAMKECGLLEAGYNYVNIDDCWQSSMRDENGEMQADHLAFPHGIKHVVEKLNEMGFKTGIYSSNGRFTCEDLPASYGHEKTDAQTFAKWGIEYFKYDFCHNVTIPFRAPYFEKISICEPSDEKEDVYLIRDAQFTGEAKILNDDKLNTGDYVSGLSSNSGSLIFDDVNVKKDGEYILTFYLKKKGDYEKYLEILVNDENIYSLFVPGTKTWTVQGKAQVKIKLKEGKNTLKMYNPVASKMDSTAKQYKYMGECLKEATEKYAADNNIEEKPIVYSICEWGTNFPWKWGRTTGNLWRTTPDIKPYWKSILAIYEVNVKLAKYAGQGGWNDPDMLEVGNGTLTYEEGKSHFSLWCMMAAPLILGNDIRQFIFSDGTVDYENRTLQIISNKDMIAVDNDELAIQCKRVHYDLTTDILIKPLKNKETAVLIFNKSINEMSFDYPVEKIIEQPYVETPFADEYELFDLWDKTLSSTTDNISAKLAGHGVCVYKIRARKDK